MVKEIKKSANDSERQQPVGDKGPEEIWFVNRADLNPNQTVNLIMSSRM